MDRFRRRAQEIKAQRLTTAKPEVRFSVSDANENDLCAIALPSPYLERTLSGSRWLRPAKENASPRRPPRPRRSAKDRRPVPGSQPLPTIAS